MDSTSDSTLPTSLSISSPITSYVYTKLTDEIEFKRNLAATIYSNSSFTSLSNGQPINPCTVAKDAINKAIEFWDALPDDWKA